MYSIWWHVKPRAPKPLPNYTPENERLELRNGSRVKEFPFQTPGKRDIIFQVLTAPFYRFLWGVNLEWFKQPWQKDPCASFQRLVCGIESQEVVHPGSLNGAQEPGKFNWFERFKSSEPNLHVLHSMLIFRGVIYNMNVLLRCLVIPPGTTRTPNAFPKSEKNAPSINQSTLESTGAKSHKTSMYIYIYTHICIYN